MGRGQRSLGSKSKVTRVKVSLQVYLLAGGLSSTSSCIFSELFQLVEDTSVLGSDVITVRTNQNEGSPESAVISPYKGRRNFNRPKLYECMLCKYNTEKKKIIWKIS